jgi:glycosyltransferase involved in cell wall biosynthesis|tara:strand:+ start:255 stop:1322 length:1068 start_codon:yes stop_codon:yes gene_type:complete
LNILLLTRYGELGASSRYRFYQFLPLLEKKDLNIKVSYLLSDSYVENLYFGNRLRSLLSVVIAYFMRFVVLLSFNKFDVIWLEKELFPWLPAFLESVPLRLGPPYIVDYDDAVFHRYDQYRSFLVKKLFGNKIKKIMRGAAVVIAGNQYIADYSKEAGAKLVEIIPTVLDLGKYHKAHQKRDGCFTIGWIGSPSTSRHLRVTQQALKEVCRNGAVQIVTIGAQLIDLCNLNASVIPWSEETEVKDLRNFDVGIMPLPDTPWERGKCGFKLIQYMACSLTVIASPVGVNKEIVDHGVNGFLAGSTEEWIKYLDVLKADPDLRQKMGSAGRKKVEERYSLQVTVPKIEKLLKETSKA